MCGYFLPTAEEIYLPRRRKEEDVIKKGFRLFSTKGNGRPLRKQAKSPEHFVRLCIADEKSAGYSVPRSGRYLYEPDYVWDEKAHAWRALFQGGGLRDKLPY